MSDVVFQGDLSLVPQTLMADVEAWSGCIAGALEEQDYLAKLRRAGFVDASVEVTTIYENGPEGSCCPTPSLPHGVRLVSGFVRAVKPSA